MTSAATGADDNAAHQLPLLGAVGLLPIHDAVLDDEASESRVELRLEPSAASRRMST
jgi:hypothetical protein